MMKNVRASVVCADAPMWALGHFEGADLGDRRRSKDLCNWLR